MRHGPSRSLPWFDDQAEEAANFYVSVFASRGGSASAMEDRRS
jgi:predicted 3-demethylubiquinone-9 3-methyltransferase (glyoxalase superfamily)